MDRMSSRLLQEVSGSARMALLPWSYKTMRYLLPREEVTGKQPVCSVTHVDDVRYIVVWGGSKIPTFETVWGLGATVVGFFM